MTLAISKAVEAGSRAVICASTGNTSASAAAYAARAGIRAFVMVPKGAVAIGKLSQAAIHGATVLVVDGNFDQALSIVTQIAERHPVTLVNSLNPFRLEGQKTGPSRWWTSSGARRTITSSPWGTPAISRPTGAATASTTARASPRSCRR